MSNKFPLGSMWRIPIGLVVPLFTDDFQDYAWGAAGDTFIIAGREQMCPADHITETIRILLGSRFYYIKTMHFFVSIKKKIVRLA